MEFKGTKGKWIPTTHSKKQFYITEQEILDKVEKEDLIRKLYKHFDLWGKCRNNSLEQLRKISEKYQKF